MQNKVGLKAMTN